MIQIAINKTCASVQHIEPITSGAINAKVQVTFDGSWNGLNKTAVFTNGAITKDVLESQWADGNIITIPHEVLTPNAAVRMGVYGYNLVDGVATAVPSVYVQLAKIRVGADPLADITTDPTLPVYAQLQWEIDHFEISDEQIAEQIQEYLEEHPIEIQPATASVLGGIKVGEGLSVTPDGTLSADAVDLSGYATEAWVESKGYLTQHQSLAGYATESYVQNYHDNTKQDVITDLATIRSGAALGATAVQPTDYASETAAGVVKTTSQFGLTTNYSTGALMGVTKSAADYATAQAHMIVSKGTLDNLGLAKSADIPTAVSELANDSGFLTQHQSLAAYRTASAQDVIDNGKQDKSLVVSITQSGATYTADKTNAEIYAAWQAGREVIAELSSSKLRCVSAMANAAYFTDIIGVETASISIENNVVTVTAIDLQPKTIADTAGYYTTDTVEGALAEIGGTLDGVEAAINTIRGIS